MDRYCEFSGTISRSAFWKFMLVEHLLFGFIIAVLGLLSENSALLCVHGCHRICSMGGSFYGTYAA